MSDESKHVVIAGGGVAGLEALLALRAMAGSSLELTLLAPEYEFTYKALSVAEPFGLGGRRAFSLLDISRDLHAQFHHAALSALDDSKRLAYAEQGQAIPYDALLIAIGAEPVEAVPGATTFAGPRDVGEIERLVAAIEAGEVGRVAFAVPEAAWWPLAVYELALLVRARANERGVSGLEVFVTTPESQPLALFGRRASDAVAELLDEAGVTVRRRSGAVRFDAGRLAFTSGQDLECDRVVALAAPSVPAIGGVPEQGPEGFIPTDRFGKVDGLRRVFAAGDATWFPIKQGGIAAQQADSVATTIAAIMGAPVTPEPFHPVLRGALLTSWGPRYLRADGPRGVSEAARSVLWWPPSKIAGRYLAPYLAARAGYREPGSHSLADLEVPVGDDPGESSDHADVVALALASADSSARWHDYRRAMRWLEVAEDLELYLPPGYESKRIAWEELAGHPA